MEIIKKNVRIWIVGNKGWVRIKLEEYKLQVIKTDLYESFFLYSAVSGIHRVMIRNKEVSNHFCYLSDIGSIQAVSDPDVKINRWENCNDIIKRYTTLDCQEERRAD